VSALPIRLVLASPVELTDVIRALGPRFVVSNTPDPNVFVIGETPLSLPPMPEGEPLAFFRRQAGPLRD
jgi:hypothetical protein